MRSKWMQEDYDRVIELWARLMLAMIRAYEGERLKMWERIPNVMSATAQQYVRLEKWLTAALRALQITTTGARDFELSITHAYLKLRDLLRAMPEGSERRALLMLPEEIMAISAEARVLWDEHKASKNKEKENGNND